MKYFEAWLCVLGHLVFWAEKTITGLSKAMINSVGGNIFYMAKMSLQTSGVTIIGVGEGEGEGEGGGYRIQDTCPPYDYWTVVHVSGQHFQKGLLMADSPSMT